ncbi:ABC transporter permease [Staphylococcus caprae]|uniref:ABC transporter permease n=1 Tax=Staphylococcus TaxID=1279 RepID=UPI0008A8D3C6|nr:MULTISPECIES: ABC transporter permease [Staphylococcus]MDK6297992.1 ABC transporter permease [Staphylococcus caprae]MDK7231449.1 ABC transporter permease [Staphylococcus caprae]OHO69529.1 sodium ABC transporter permease [Staphylococcus sp. HMSC036D05]
MNKFWSTFKLTYLSKIKSKAFIIFMSIIVILMIALSNIDKIIDLFDNGPDKVGVVTQNEQIYKVLKKQSHALDDDATFKKVSEKDAHKLVKNEKLKKAYIVKQDKHHQLSGTILSKDNVEAEDEQKLTEVLTSIQSQLVASNLNLSQNELKQLQARSHVDSKVISNKEDSQLNSGEQTLNYILVYATLMLIFFIVFNYAGQVAMEIATEKTSRVIEMIITSVSPVIHILAKIAGVIAVAFTQVIMIIIMALLCVYAFDLKSLFKEFDIQMNHLAWQIIIVSILCLIVGILSYVLLAAILGSLATRIEDMNQTLMPLTLLAMIAFYIAIFSIMKPDMLLTKITSFIPFLAPFELLVRAQSSDLEIWEIAVSMGISIIVVALLLWIAVKTYKDSVLTFEKGLFKSIQRLVKKN